jgi:peroxiredoxin
MHVRWQRPVTALILAVAVGYAGYLVVPIVKPASIPAAHEARAQHRSPKVGLAVGDLAPNFTLDDIHGHAVTLWALRGHAVWLNFWATWCPWCRREMPDIQKVHVLYGSRIDIYGIDLQESRSTVVRWLAAHHIHYDVLLDASGTVSTTYDVSKLPTSVFIDAHGRITAVYVGALLSVVSMKPYINQALGR